MTGMFLLDLFPSIQRGLVGGRANFCEDSIYKAVSQAVRTLSYRIRREHGKKTEGVPAVEGETGNDKMEVEMAGDDEHYGGGPASIIDDEEAVTAAEEVLQRQKQGEDMVVEQHDEEKEVTDEEMRAAAIELEDLLDLMMMKVRFRFPHCPDLFLPKLITVYNSPKHLLGCRT